MTIVTSLVSLVTFISLDVIKQGNYPWREYLIGFIGSIIVIGGVAYLLFKKNAQYRLYFTKKISATILYIMVYLHYAGLLTWLF